MNTLDAQRLAKIRDLESYERPKLEEKEPEGQRPVFITPLNRYRESDKEECTNF